MDRNHEGMIMGHENNYYPFEVGAKVWWHEPEFLNTFQVEIEEIGTCFVLFKVQGRTRETGKENLYATKRQCEKAAALNRITSAIEETSRI